MNFLEALKAYDEGFPIKRPHWANESHWQKDGMKSLFLQDTTAKRALVNWEDLLADDWELMEKENE